METVYPIRMSKSGKVKSHARLFAKPAKMKLPLIGMQSTIVLSSTTVFHLCTVLEYELGLHLRSSVYSDKHWYLNCNSENQIFNLDDRVFEWIYYLLVCSRHFSMNFVVPAAIETDVNVEHTNDECSAEKTMRKNKNPNRLKLCREVV